VLPLFFANLFRLHFVTIFPLGPRLKLVDQQATSKKPIQGLARFAAAPDADSGRSMLEIYPGPTEKCLVQVFLGTLDGFHPFTQESRFFLGDWKSQHESLSTQLVKVFQQNCFSILGVLPVFWFNIVAIHHGFFRTTYDKSQGPYD
jgi:hypothetical protein